MTEMTEMTEMKHPLNTLVPSLSESKSSFLLSASANVAAILFLKLLTTPWIKTDAYKLGIVDEKGKALKKVREMSTEEKRAYTLFHRLVFNIKRLLGRIPFANRLPLLTSFFTAFMLLKENSEFDLFSSDTRNDTFVLLSEQNDNDSALHSLSEALEHIFERGEASSIPLVFFLDETKTYTAARDLINTETFEPTIPEGSTLSIFKRLKSEDDYFMPMYLAIDEQSGETTLISAGDVDNDITSSSSSMTSENAENAENAGGFVNTSSVGYAGASIPMSVYKNKPFSVFDVDDETFERFLTPRKKYSRWSSYVSTEEQNNHPNLMKIKNSVQKGNLVFLRDSKGRASTIQSYSNISFK